MAIKSWTLSALAVLALGAGRCWADEQEEFAGGRLPATSATTPDLAPAPVPAVPPWTICCPAPSFWHRMRDQATNLCRACLPTPREHPCLRRFWEWATYRAVARPGLCGCHRECVPCGATPNYLYFLCDRFGPMGFEGGGIGGPGGGCGCAGAGCAH
jgi:hypothetical protein